MPTAGGLLTKGVQDAVTLLASGTVIATSTGTAAVALPRPDNAVVFVLDVTAGGTDATDAIDVFVQTTLDGTNWFDIVAFTQIVGNAPTKTHVGKVCANSAQTMYATSTGLSAGNVRHLLGDRYRVRYVITSGNSPTFTFSVTALPM